MYINFQDITIIFVNSYDVVAKFYWLLKVMMFTKQRVFTKCIFCLNVCFAIVSLKRIDNILFFVLTKEPL